MNDGKVENNDQLIINTIRTLSMDAVQKANSGHPGTPMALAPVAYLLWDRFIRHNPANPEWPNRDRFILSAGHASMLLYSTLHLLGYDISLDDIKNFRQLHSKCAGHPEYGLAPGIETTTGPLGQGVANSVGFAIAQRWLASYFNRPDFEIIDYNIFAIPGDGCMMEGISSEAASLAGHLGLSNLIWIYDNNHITIEGNTELAFSEDVATRFEAYHWNVNRVSDVNDLDLLEQTINSAIKEKNRPSLIIVDSHIAYGSPTKQDTSGAHGEPLGEDEIRATKENYGWDPDRKFYIPDEVESFRKTTTDRGRRIEAKWDELFNVYAKSYSDLANQFQMMQNHELPESWDQELKEYPADEKGIAGRQASGEVLNIIANSVPWLMGGSADLAPSTKTYIKESSNFDKSNYSGRNFHFGIREHAMGAIINGMSLSKIRPYGATFLVFADYVRPAIRLSAIMGQPVIYIFTHDSISIGEDGPTHQPVEQIASLRAIPNIDVFRPADANEVVAMWKHVMKLNNRPAALILTRQAIPTIDREKYASADGALKGAYVLADCDGEPEIIIIGTGSEVQLCISAHEILKKDGIKSRVVSMPCWRLFERQDPDYWKEVLPRSVSARIAVEAGSSYGWRRYVGKHGDGDVLGVRDFGASAPISDILKEYGITVDRIIEMVRKRLDKKR